MIRCPKNTRVSGVWVPLIQEQRTTKHETYDSRISSIPYPSFLPLMSLETTGWDKGEDGEKEMPKREVTRCGQCCLLSVLNVIRSSIVVVILFFFYAPSEIQAVETTDNDE